MINKEWDSSPIMREFEKTAAELGWITTNLNPKDKDFVGNPSKSPVGPFRNNPMKDEKELTTDKNPCKDYDITKETGEDLIGKAHKKSPTMADAMGEGALVENVVEQQKKDIEVATKMPNGALVQVHAALIQSLVKLANEFDEHGKHKVAQEIDGVIEKLARPFVNRQAITKEAFWPALIFWGLTALTGAGAALGFFASRREGLVKDIKDLYEALQSATIKPPWYSLYSSTTSPSAKKALQVLEPFVPIFQNLDFTDNKKIMAFAEQIEKFKPVFNDIGKLIEFIEAELGESRMYELDRVKKIRSNYSDVKDDLEFITSKFNEIAGMGQKVMQQKEIKPSAVSELQSILIENNLLKTDKADGSLNEETIKATKILEELLSKQLSALDIRKSFKDKILLDNKLIMEPEKLREIIGLIKKELGKQF